MGNIKIIVLISGRGSNLKAIAEECKKKRTPAEIIAIISNNEFASGLKINGKFKKIVIKGKKKTFEKELQTNLIKLKPDLICLAGFMKILSPFIIKKWKNKIINVHPSLLPSFKGLDTHKRALETGVKISGCTIHFVNESLDEGPIIAQGAITIKKNMSSVDLQKEILKLEHIIYPKVIHLFSKKKILVKQNKVFINDKNKEINKFIKNV
tara:strand:+ start:5522 stop:6151 length:630 start_codon:yes stop_codon:yes gene_type:complete